MLQKTYIVLAHKTPEQLKRLIDKINDENSFFFIHIDKKSDIEPFTKIIHGENIKFIEDRVNCLWGDFSQIIATINLIRAAVESGRSGMVIQLTGQDYPIKSAAEIDNFLENHADKNFIDSIPVEKIWTAWQDKTESYKFNISSGRGVQRTFRKVSKASLKSFFRREISLGQLLLLLKKRKLSLGLRQYGGSAWWAFNAPTMKKMYDYITANYKVLCAYYKYTICPDEIFFQTIAHHLSEADSSVKLLPSITYVNWQSVGNAPSPVTFTVSHLEELKQQPENLLFARKFDMEMDSQILDEIDKITKCVK
ncbi:MAG: beta-1,6-N-acetylglucosaminyltransferase [Paludibacter sp.]|nr:beta-1,6-N-acetylglucosaminyltransferase [Paludibacter sp.]